MLRRLAAATTLGLMLAGGILPAAAPPPHPALARGLALMREGDFEAAVLELDAAARKIEADPAAARHRAWAYVYLGVAYLELEQEAVARGKFREALARDAALQLLPGEFSAQSIRVFEGVRAEAAVAVPPVAPARTAAPVGTAAPAEKKGSKGPLVAVLVGGAAAAGAAVALGGGGGGEGGGTTSTTPNTATVPAPSPSPSEPPSTTVPPGTPSPTVPPTTNPTPPPSCSYNIGGQVNVPLTGCIGCSCSVSATPNSCSWNAQTSDPGMITITQGSGTGNGNVVFNVGVSVSPRTGRITLAQGGGTCTVSQGTLLSAEAPSSSGEAVWISELDLAGGSGQIVVDGSSLTYQRKGIARLSGPASGSRVEALVVSAAGRPGTWRFRLPAGARPGSLRVVAGDVAAIAADTVTFRLAGRPGERVVFTFVQP